MRPGLSLISALYQKRNAFSLVGIIKSQSLWLGLMLVCMLMYLAHAEALLRYDRALLGQGELWRMFSGQMLHLNWPHYWLNMAGVAIVAIFFNQDLTKRQWLILMLFSSMFISVCLYYFDPGMLWYMGMSGVLHTLFVVGAWYERRRFAISGYALLALISSKLVYEQFGGGLASSEALIGARVAVDAHFFGAIAGVIFLLAMKLREISRK